MTEPWHVNDVSAFAKQHENAARDAAEVTGNAPCVPSWPSPGEILDLFGIEMTEDQQRVYGDFMSSGKAFQQIPHRNRYSAYRAATATAMGGALERAFPRASLEHLVSERTRDLPTVDTSPMTRVVQAHAKKVVEQIDEALVRALQHTDHFEVHVYEWSTYGDHTRGEHKVVFNAAVQIVVKPDGGPEIIRHPYGEEPLHDERRD